MTSPPHTHIIGSAEGLELASERDLLSRARMQRLAACPLAAALVALLSH